MSTIIYLNVGGKHFETTMDTLLFSPYFKGIVNLNGSINSTKESPYFIDRDPKIFRHVLNLLRNPDYNYPGKYLSELEFYGFSVEELREFIAKNKKILYDSIIPSYIHTPDKITDIPNVVIPRELSVTKSDPAITLFAHVYRRHTDFDDLHIETFKYETYFWEHKYIKSDYVLVDIYVLIPICFYNKLNHFTITISFNKFDSCTFNLEALLYLKCIAIYDDWCCIDLMQIFTRGQKLFVTNNAMTISLEHNLKENIVTFLKTRKARMFPEELHRSHLFPRILLLSKLDSYKIIDDRFILPVGEIVFIIFNTAYDVVIIEYHDEEGKIIPEKSIMLSKFDTRFLSGPQINTNLGFTGFPEPNFHTIYIGTGAIKHTISALPEDYGLVSFCLYEPFNVQPSGSLTSTGRQSIRFLSNDKENSERSGIIWIYKYYYVDPQIGLSI